MLSELKMIMGDKVMNKQGAGFVVFKKGSIESSSPVILALIQEDGVLDLPKGRIDPGETPLETAVRECFEECSLVIGNNDMILKDAGPFVYGALTLFCAESSAIPSITVNPHNGVLEHVGFKWVNEEEFLSNCLPFLAPGVSYFYSKI